MCRQEIQRSDYVAHELPLHNAKAVVIESANLHAVLDLCTAVASLCLLFCGIAAAKYRQPGDVSIYISGNLPSQPAKG